MTTLTSYYNHRDSLDQKRRVIDRQLDELVKNHGDSMEIATLKKQKLLLKEQSIQVNQKIEKIESDILAVVNEAIEEMKK